MKQKLIPAKPTSYNGIRFRSRLEARWAVFFDHMRMAWQYEPELPFISLAASHRPDFQVRQVEKRCWSCIDWESRHPDGPMGFTREEWEAEYSDYFGECSCVHGFNIWVEIKPLPPDEHTIRLLQDIANKSFDPFGDNGLPTCLLLLVGSPGNWRGWCFVSNLVLEMFPGQDGRIYHFQAIWGPAGIESAKFAERFRFW